MHKSFLQAGIISLVACCGGVASAQTEGSRYTMAPTDGGFVRLDTVTGAMSLCSKEGEDWSCRPMKTDEEKSAAKPGDELGVRPSPPRAVPELELPSEQDVDAAIDYLEGMIRKFRERFEDFGEKTRPDRGPGPHPTPRSDVAPDPAPAPAPAPPPETVPNGTPNGAPNGAPKVVPNSGPESPERQL